MRNTLLILTALLVTEAALADNYTRGYTRRDGTYVAPHYSTEPNAWRHDNYSGRGNTNPYTGQRGSQRHEFTNPPAYNTGRKSPSNANPYSNPYGSQPRRSRQF
jgi:hypothetical protein